MPLLVEAREAQQHTVVQPAPIAKLKAGYVALALQIQEAASGLTASSVGRKLQAAVSDAHKGTGKWVSYLDHAGDDDSGDVIYSCSGDTMSCPYEITGNGDGVAATAKLDLDSAKKVSPRVTYEDMPDDEDDDGMANMYEAWRRDGMYAGEIPLFERFVSKAERDQMDSGDFAGKGKSFPINKPGDIMAAVHSMGRAGSGNYGPAALKANIIRIAKKKGWTKYLPQAWQGGGSDAKEGAGAGARETDGLRLVESAATVEAIRIQEARADYPIKLIAPGAGASAYYPQEVLERDGPKVFRAGTHVYLNHATQAEEAARPEGDMRNLAGVLTSTAEYQESGPKGPGLYARMKVFADHAQMVEEKAPYVGMSIRASGIAESGKTRDGKPVLKELTGAESVDVVTRAGAGGMILTEAAGAAKPNQGGAETMTAAEQQQVTRLMERAIRGDAREAATRILAGVTLPEAAKQRVIETVLVNVPTKDGEVDAVRLTESVNAAAKAEGQYLAAIAPSRVYGMGASAGAVEIDAKEAERREAQEKRRDEEDLKVFESLMGGNKEAAKLALVGRVA